MKAFCSEAQQRACLVGAELGGERGRRTSPSPATSRGTSCSWIEQYFPTFGTTISAGSSEIQRNIIAEQVLGLPRG